MPTMPEQNKANRILLTVMSIMSGVQVVAGGIVLIDIVPADLSGILLLIVGGVNAAVMYYINGRVVDLNTVVAYQPNKHSNSGLYAGGASTELTGTKLSVNSPIGTLAERYVSEYDEYHEVS